MWGERQGLFDRIHEIAGMHSLRAVFFEYEKKRSTNMVERFCFR